jgi:hypothetical protein
MYENQEELLESTSRFENLAVAYNVYSVPPFSSKPNAEDAGSQPGIGRLNMTFQTQGLSESSWPSLLSSTESLGASSRVIEQMRKGIYPDLAVISSD